MELNKSKGQDKQMYLALSNLNIGQSAPNKWYNWLLKDFQSSHV